ncbi:unnamed protein product [Didymodactylos carnosus]|uniref:Autophagy-related protein 101 n=1 Tax=Didymodactylos carnosus TaxID=1234261 RepID=A0A8S2DQH9_9BILA|nr:unnamed protein product [Didymodactylos carnosus]CAF3743927.1 unnamed protein product [Didymodactylos carnosus]
MYLNLKKRPRQRPFIRRFRSSLTSAIVSSDTSTSETSFITRNTIENYSTKEIDHLELSVSNERLSAPLLRVYSQTSVVSSLPSPSLPKRFFRVARYSINKTNSKELLIEHELGENETRHRLIEIRTNNNQEKNPNLILAAVAFLINPPIGLTACIFGCLAKNRYESLNLDSGVETRNDNNHYHAVNDVYHHAGRYSIISYILSMLAIGITAVEGRQIDEVISCMFHTILFHRCVGKGEDSYSVGTLGYTDVDCDFVDCTYLHVTSQELQRAVAEKISQFHDALRSSDGARAGQITLEFYQKKKQRWFSPESVPWEIWTVKIELMQLTNENEKQFLREKLTDSLSERVFQITEIINRPDYVPKPPHLSELDLVFDTNYVDIQPYLFKISYSLDGPQNLSVGLAMRRLIKDAFGTSL